MPEIKNKKIEKILDVLEQRFTRGDRKHIDADVETFEIKEFVAEALEKYGKEQKIEGGRKYRNIMGHIDKVGYTNEEVLFLREVNNK